MSKADEIDLDLQKIAKIQKLYVEIFEEEDCDCPDYRVIRPKENAIFKMLFDYDTTKIISYKLICKFFYSTKI